MDFETVEQFKVVGISVRTSNENGQAAQDLAALWGRWMAEGISSQIPNKMEDSIYCVYTGYEKDHTRPYTAILGCRVTGLDIIPDGMIGINIPSGNYKRYTAKGNILTGAVFNEWLKIWNQDLTRNFVADYEVYGPKAQNPENAEVDIFVGIR